MLIHSFNQYVLTSDKWICISHALFSNALLEEFSQMFLSTYILLSKSKVLPTCYFNG